MRRLLLLIVIWLGHLPALAEDLDVLFLDVGQGDATVVSTAEGKTGLIDAGPRDAGPRILRALEQVGASSISLFVLTHPHLDHVGGMPYILSRIPVAVMVDPAIPHPIPAYSKALSLFRLKQAENKAEYVRGTAGKTVALGKEVGFKILSPVENEIGKLPLNESSIVGRLGFGNTCILFMGDAGARTEQKLVESKSPIRCDVLKVGHHGSSSSTTKAFLDAVKPIYALISVGKGNPYGHPSNKVLKRLSEAQVIVLRTDALGTVWFVSDGTSIRLKQ